MPYCHAADNERVWQNHFSPGSHFWPDELPFQMKNCNATLIAYPRKKKFHFPVEAIKSTEVAEHKWGSHNSNFQFFEVELQLLGRWWILLKRFPIHFSYIFNNFSSTFDVDKKWIIRIFFFIAGGILWCHLNPIHHKQTRVLLFFFEATIHLQCIQTKCATQYKKTQWLTLYFWSHEW